MDIGPGCSKKHAEWVIPCRIYKLHIKLCHQNVRNVATRPVKIGKRGALYLYHEQSANFMDSLEMDQFFIFLLTHPSIRNRDDPERILPIHVLERLWMEYHTMLYIKGMSKLFKLYGF